MTTLVFRPVAAVVSRRFTLLTTFGLALFILAFAVPTGPLFFFGDKSPAAGSDRLRKLGTSPGEAMSLNDPATTAKQVIIRPVQVVLGEPVVIGQILLHGLASANLPNKQGPKHRLLGLCPET